MLKKILIGLAAAFVLYTFYFLWAQAQKDPVIFNLVSPVMGDIERTVTATGRLEPRMEVNIKPQVTGTVQSISVKMGDKVSRGQVLATVRIIPDQTSLASARSSVNVAKVRLDQAEREYLRSKGMYEKKVISLREFQASEAEYNQALQAWQGSCSMLDVAKQGYNDDGGNVTQVRSSIDGTVMDVPVKEGTSVVSTSIFSEGTTIATVARMSDIIFKGTIDETDAEFLQAGQPMHLVVGSMKNRKFDGVLESISPRGKSHNGTIQFDVEARVSIPDDVAVRAGYSANADFVIENSANTLLVDEGCIEYENGRTFVNCLTSDPSDEKKQVFERREVILGVSNGIQVEVKDGIDTNSKLKGLVKQ